jgi:hypothetical protein
VTITFGDNVRVLPSPETDSLKISGLTGVVYGETTPSITGVTVIGKTADDYAFNVNFGDALPSQWLAPQLLEFIDHAPGSVAKVGTKEFVRDESGDWKATTTNKPWWKFW